MQTATQHHPTTVQAPPDLIDQRAAAQLIGCSVRTLERYRAGAIGPAWRKLGPRRIVYLRAEVLRWISE